MGTIKQKPSQATKVPRTGGVPQEPVDPVNYKEKANRPTRYDPYDDPQDPSKAPD